HVADYQRELETYTGRSWEDFFEHWVRGSGMCDWAVERVTIDRALAASRNQPVRVVIDLKQKGEFNEPTVLGIRLNAGDGYQVRLPIYPDVTELNLQDPPAHIEGRILPGVKEGKGQAEVRVELLLPREPIQITVDPDHVLLDQDP